MPCHHHLEYTAGYALKDKLKVTKCEDGFDVSGQVSPISSFYFYLFLPSYDRRSSFSEQDDKTTMAKQAVYQAR